MVHQCPVVAPSWCVCCDVSVSSAWCISVLVCVFWRVHVSGMVCGVRIMVCQFVLWTWGVSVCVMVCLYCGHGLSVLVSRPVSVTNTVSM